jgi:hypothetical protein
MGQEMYPNNLIFENIQLESTGECSSISFTLPLRWKIFYLINMIIVPPKPQNPHKFSVRFSYYFLCAYLSPVSASLHKLTKYFSSKREKVGGSGENYSNFNQRS